ncbi:MAG: hypothetical protein AAFV45_02120 [Pseudomonadota bacterium]
MTASDAGGRRNFTVAVTGHRPNRLTLGDDALRRKLQTVLRALRSGADGRAHVAVSALAEGADRMFAEAALTLGYTLHALLPFPRDAYETTFSDPSETPAYQALLARAQAIRELPFTLDDTKAAYEAVGQATVDTADILVAVWDGEPAAGRGGTPEIIGYARARGLPVIWVDARRLTLPRHITPPSCSGRNTIPLATAKSRAQPLTRRRIVKLAKMVATRQRP